MYLLDGEHRIMISDALNESDRLSACDKRMRKAMAGMSVPFNIYEFRAGEVGESDSAQSEPMKYNVGGIRMSGAAYNRLREENSLDLWPLQFPRLLAREQPTYCRRL